MSPQHPPARVLAAFGAAEERFLPIRGGQGTSWLAGELVLKPADIDESQLEWQESLYSAIHGEGFRVARPLRAADGSICVDGWCAWERVAGRHQPGRWPQIIAVGERFHSALNEVPRPGFLDRRADPWAVSDRVAWGEIPADQFAQVDHVPRLTAALRPVGGPSQLIHGDLTGNVMFDEHLPPAIIDLSPYWRPTGFASAIVVADALVFESADEAILSAVSHIDDFGQFLLRALIFRVVADWLLRQPGRPQPRGETVHRWSTAVDLACRLARTEP